MSNKIDLSASAQKWPLKIMIARVLWGLIWPLVKWLPKCMSNARIIVLRSFGAKIGRRCLIMPGVRVLMPWNLRMGDFVALGSRVDVYNFALVDIKSMTVVSQDCFICTGSHDFRDSKMSLIYEPITIGAEVWVAARSVLLPGVNVADGVVVGLGAIVSKSLHEPWMVYAGMPAKAVSCRKMRE